MRWIAVVSVALLLGSCGRTSVTLTFGGDPSRLDESAVINRERSSSVKVALIDVRGVLLDGPRPALFQSGTNPVDDLVARLDKAASDPRVKAVVLRINSPGGAVTATDTMYRELRRFREQTGKPVVASVGEIAASGGYYLALGADRIVAQPTSITGSVGVIIPTVNVSAGLNRIGIVSRSITSGANKDLANPLEPMREGQYAVLREMVDAMYARFRELVLERRTSKDAAAPMDPARADELLDGRVMVGEAAMRAGLVDQLGDVHDAVAAAEQLAGVTRARVVMYHAEGERPRTVYGAMAASATGTASSAARGAGADDTEINLMQVNVSGAGLGGGGLGPLSAGVAYYVWTP